MDDAGDLLSLKEGVKFLVYGVIFFAIISAVAPHLTAEQARDIDRSVDDNTKDLPTSGEAPALCSRTDELISNIKTHGQVKQPTDYSNHLIIDYKGEAMDNWTATSDRSGHGDFTCTQDGPNAPEPGYFYCEAYRDTPLVLDSVDGTETVRIDTVILDEFKSMQSVSCASDTS